MPVHNADIARIFRETAELLSLEGANPFRVRAYRRAGRTIGGLPTEVHRAVARDEPLSDLPGIGEDLADKIRTVVRTGSLPLLEELRAGEPGALHELLAIDGLGPVRVRRLHRELGITSPGQLREAAEQHRLRDLAGFGPRREARLLAALDRQSSATERVPLAEAEQYAEALVRRLRRAPGVQRVTVAGSYRRRCDTVGDLDLLVVCDRPAAAVEALAADEDTAHVLARGQARASVQLRSGLQVDLRLVSAGSHGAALHAFTGARPYVVAMRRRARRRDRKLSRHGVFAGERRLAGATEEEVFDALDLPWIPPELREDRGAIAAAERGELPDLVTGDDIRGDLHAHTDWTDGRSSLREMATAARERGYQYLAITDHSRRVTVAGGLDAGQLLAQVEEIDALNAELDRLTVLRGVEVDILRDGRLDLPDEVLDRLDVVVASVHSYLDLDADTQTDRILRALDNPHVHILGHPTGRMLGKRGGCDLDLPRLIAGARERGVALEINAQPNRLDLRGEHLAQVRELDARVAIGTDAHWTTHLDHMRLGVDQARRGWLQTRHVINTRSLGHLRRQLRRRGGRS